VMSASGYRGESLGTGAAGRSIKLLIMHILTI
jgi:hypothetical protein